MFFILQYKVAVKTLSIYSCHSIKRVRGSSVPVSEEENLFLVDSK